MRKLLSPSFRPEAGRNSSRCGFTLVELLAVIELATKSQIPLSIAGITIEELLDADEVFLTNSAMGIMPVTRIERKPIADDELGPITQQLSELYQQLL